MLKNTSLTKRLGSLKTSAQSAARSFSGKLQELRAEQSDAAPVRRAGAALPPAEGCLPGPSGQQSGALSYGDRVAKFTEVLAAEVIDLSRLRALARDGVPDTDGLRALTWKLLLGYLPPDTSKWNSLLMKKRAEYEEFCEELIVRPGSEDGSARNADAAEEPLEGALAAVDVTHDDHPLSQGSTSVWNAFFRDVEVMEQIERDVMRTHPDMHFFSGDKSQAVRHRKEMQRALFVYAKLNPGLTYVQGMNELLAPIYYTLRTDVDEDAREAAEADAFWCFIDLMTEFRDNYCKQLDNSDQGVKATMARLSRLLARHDPELHTHLETTSKIDPQFYAFRWITLILTQEHAFPDTMRLWDTILSFPKGRADFLLKGIC